jgi:hypothetical protein
MAPKAEWLDQDAHALFTRKRCDGLPEAIDPLPIITLSPVSCTKVEVC